jgi:very-short-patch-repair endonuclease
VLACGSDAVISHETAGVAWRMSRRLSGLTEVSVPASANPRVSGIRVHRRSGLRAEDVTHVGVIPITSPIRTLIDLGTRLTSNQLEAAINEADKLDLVDPETLRRALDDYAGQPGVGVLRDLLDRHTFRLTDSELERRFLRIVRDAGLPVPETQARVCGFRVDFYWPELGLVVETDGLRYHRTAAQQAKDRHRDQALIAAGLTVLRFSHADVRYAPQRVVEILRAIRS